MKESNQFCSKQISSAIYLLSASDRRSFIDEVFVWTTAWRESVESSKSKASSCLIFVKEAKNSHWHWTYSKPRLDKEFLFSGEVEFWFSCNMWLHFLHPGKTINPLKIQIPFLQLPDLKNISCDIPLDLWSTACLICTVPSLNSWCSTVLWTHKQETAPRLKAHSFWNSVCFRDLSPLTLTAWKTQNIIICVPQKKENPTGLMQVIHQDWYLTGFRCSSVVRCWGYVLFWQLSTTKLLNV